MAAASVFARLRRGGAWPAWLAGPLIPILVAIGLGSFEIGAKSLWLDEAFSVDLSRRPSLELLRYLATREMHASPYYLALHGWLALGSSEAVVRWLSVLVGAAAVAATWAVGRRFGVGFAAALLLAVAPFFVEFEQEARGYTMLVAASSLATLAFLRLAEAPARGRWIAYLVLAASIIYVHPLGAFVIVAHGIWAAVEPGPIGRRRWLAAGAAIATAWVPMVAFAATHREKIDWIQPVTPQLFGQDLMALGGGALVAGALAVLIASGLRAHGRAALPVVLWAIVPLVGVLLLSVAVQPALQAKYLLMTLPAATILAARNPRPALAALVALSLVGVGDWYANGRKEDYRAAAAWVTSEARPDDGLVFAPPYLRIAYSYYAKYPAPAWPGQPWSSRDGSAVGAAVNAVEIRRHVRIWLVLSHGRDAPDAVWAALAGYHEAARRMFGIDQGPEVVLLVRDGP